MQIDTRSKMCVFNSAVPFRRHFYRKIIWMFYYNFHDGESGETVGALMYIFKMTSSVETEMTAEKPRFECSLCGFECHYDYFGNKPPFSKSIVYVHGILSPMWYLEKADGPILYVSFIQQALRRCIYNSRSFFTNYKALNNRRKMLFML